MLHDEIPKDNLEAINLIASVLELDETDLSELPADEFKLAWNAIFFLYTGLHPDDALDHGDEIIDHTQDHPDSTGINYSLLRPYFVRSGWPVALIVFVAEAWRRYNEGMLTDEEFYCSDSQYIGIIRSS